MNEQTIETPAIETKAPVVKKPAAKKAAPSKAEQVREILRQAWEAGEHKQVKAPSDFFIHPRCQRIIKAKQEYFIVAGLNSSHQVIRAFRATIGTANRCMVHPREVFGPLVKMRAVACIVAHNHPSGNLEPSEEDINVTKRLVEAGAVLDIRVLDHLIVGRSGYASLAQLGHMPL